MSLKNYFLMVTAAIKNRFLIDEIQYIYYTLLSILLRLLQE